MSDVTRLLNAACRGERQAADRLIPLVYQELRELARRRLSREGAGHTLDATALVHEAYLRLVGPEGLGTGQETGREPGRAARWDGRGHLFAAAAEAMRRILVESARRKHSVKHGGGLARVELEAEQIAAPAPQDGPQEDLLALDAVLQKLAEHDPAKAELVKLRYFAGLSLPEAAEVLGLSLRTAERHWTYAKVWLLRELNREKS